MVPDNVLAGGAAGVLIGIGLDLVETARVERAFARFGERFVHKLMDAEEAAVLPPGSEQARALAVAVAVKEAASKALGTGWSNGVRWRDVVVSTPAGDDPGHLVAAVRLHGRAAEVARARGSSGRTRARVERRGPLVIAEVWLLS
jgi:holo-[acyl-carrier protein] synthase